MKKWLERLGFVSLFLTLITLAVTITINFRPLYAFSVKQLNILEGLSLTKEQLLENYRLLLAFLNNPFNQVLSLPDFPMSESGLGHFYDVKWLFLLNYGVLLLTLVPSIYFVYHLIRNQRQWRLIQPFRLGMVLPLIFGLLMTMGFDRFFITFHEMFFRNDDWLFNPVTDPIINVLPETFFMYCFILFFVLIEGFFLFFFLYGKFSLKKATKT